MTADREGKRRFGFRLAMIFVVAAACAVGAWMIVHVAEKPDPGRLGEMIAMLGSETVAPEIIEEVRAAGAYKTFQVLTAMLSPMVKKPEREWTFKPEETLRALIELHGASSAGAADAFLPALKDPEPRIRAWGAYAISRCCRKRTGMGPIPSHVLSAVVDAMGDADPQVREEACDCFVDVHSDWRMGLISCLDHPSPLIRCTAIDALGGRGSEDDRIGRFPDAVVPMLDDPDARVRAQAAVSLAQLKRGSERVLELLRDSIRGVDDPDLRISACSAVGYMGRAALAAVPDLIACLEDADEAIRRCAATSLADIDPGAAVNSEAACAILIKAVEEGGMAAVFAARSLGNLGAAAPASVVTVLERASTSNHAFVREEANGALNKIRSEKK